MKILITGCNGQLGNCLHLEFDKDPEIEGIYTDYDTLDITDRAAVERFLDDNKFDYVINCAAYTAVDKAETDEILASALNTGAVGNLAEAALRHNTRVIHISTDYVFSGESFRPYEENDEPYPQGIYGRTKLEGEALLTSFCKDAMIIRTAWLYSEFGKNFVKTMLQLAETHDSLNVVCDQLGSPTYAGDLAKAIHQIVKHNTWKPGIYHFTDEGVASWYDFSKAIFEIAGKKIKVLPVSTSEYPTPAKRPLYSVLSKRKIKSVYGLEIPYWRDSLAHCINIIAKQK
ncbi:MAG: dTDP-4-dehydrorhamnose reductase [Candidatus Amulumruptor caecigallinarius]|nr:dTDP-4-dehydrorhamnose reductase [Candidatus Amulumruptor caecigallinarius]